MSHTVEWHPKTRKFLKKLPKEIANRIITKVNDVLKNPFRYLEHYKGEKLYKLRVGDYRLLIDVDKPNKIMKVQVIGHRKNIYERLK